MMYRNMGNNGIVYRTWLHGDKTTGVTMVSDVTRGIMWSVSETIRIVNILEEHLTLFYSLLHPVDIRGEDIDGEPYNLLIKNSGLEIYAPPIAEEDLPTLRISMGRADGRQFLRRLKEHVSEV